MRKDVSCVILYDKQNKVLLQHRTEDTDRLPGYWAFFGGKVEEGETPREAAIREAYEELEFVSENLELLMRQGFELEGQNQMKNVFIELCRDKSSLVLHEGQGWGWYDIDETERLKMIFHDREVLQYMKKEVFKK